jgi:acetyl-CoA carboxylase biotin carboxyl carrier protein
MTGAKIPLLVETQADRGTVLRAPKIGLWSNRPAAGSGVVPGSSAGTLTQLARRYTLLVPEGVEGRVVYETRGEAAVPVEFGQPLFHVEPHAAGEAPARAKGGKTARAATGTLEIVAPTDGVFYRAPSAGAAPYVAPGDRITSGQAVGLIEVMKTFNPIAYGGPGLPDEAVVVAVLAGDGVEVRAGQGLVSIKAG